MIQRIQSLWLLLAAACTTATFFLPFYSGNMENQLYQSVTAMSNFLLLIGTVAVLLGSLAAIFFYKSRKKQGWIVVASFILQLICLTFFILETKAFAQGDMSITALFYFLVPVFLVLAWINIRKDEKLIQSMDRLR